MKIALFTDSFLPGVGGTEKAVLGLAESYTKLGHQVLVACPKYKKGLDVSQFPFQVVISKSLMLDDNNCLAFPDKKYYKQIYDFNPDIVHVQTVSPIAASGAKVAKKLGVPLVSTVHTKFRQAFQKGVKLKLITNILIGKMVKLLNKCNKVYSVSNDMKPELLSYGYKGEVTIIRNGAMLKPPKNLKESAKKGEEFLKISPKDFLLLFVGNVTSIKNLNLSLEAFYKLQQNHSNLKFAIIGDGVDRTKYENYCKKQNIQDKVIFTGRISNTEVLSSIFARSNLFLFPSVFDNDPLTVVEAAVHQTPAVVIENTGASERIENNVSGFTIKNNIEDYVARLEEILKDKDLLNCVSNNASLKIPKDWQTTAKEYLEEYKKLITQKN